MRFLPLMIMLVLAGCERQPAPAFSVSVDVIESTDYVGLEIQFYALSANSRIAIHNLEELDNCKEQIGFLVEAMEDAEKKMMQRAEIKNNKHLP